MDLDEVPPAVQVPRELKGGHDRELVAVPVLVQYPQVVDLDLRAHPDEILGLPAVQGGGRRFVRRSPVRSHDAGNVRPVRVPRRSVGPILVGYFEERLDTLPLDRHRALGFEGLEDGPEPIAHVRIVESGEVIPIQAVDVRGPGAEQVTHMHEVVGRDDARVVSGFSLAPSTGGSPFLERPFLYLAILVALSKRRVPCVHTRIDDRPSDVSALDLEQPAGGVRLDRRRRVVQ